MPVARHTYNHRGPPAISWIAPGHVSSAPLGTLCIDLMRDHPFSWCTHHQGTSSDVRDALPSEDLC